MLKGGAACSETSALSLILPTDKTGEVSLQNRRRRHRAIIVRLLATTAASANEDGLGVRDD